MEDISSCDFVSHNVSRMSGQGRCEAAVLVGSIGLVLRHLILRLCPI